MRREETLFIGLDCGGTQCKARLVDGSGRCLGEGLAGPANGLLGMEAVFAEIECAVNRALSDAQRSDIPLGHLHAGIGMAGLCSQQVRDEFDAYTHPFASMCAETDAHIAQLGAFGGGDGAILIVGTGSCGYAIVNGKVITRGGHGFLISDQGSGAALGRAALRRAVQAAENIHPMTPVCDAILARFDHSIDAIIDWARMARPADYGAFVPLIFEHSGQDALAEQLIRHSASEVEELILALRHSGALCVVLVGGMAEPLKGWLSEPTRTMLTTAQGDALAGACLLAAEGYKQVTSNSPAKTGSPHA